MPRQWRARGVIPTLYYAGPNEVRGYYSVLPINAHGRHCAVVQPLVPHLICICQGCVPARLVRCAPGRLVLVPGVGPLRHSTELSMASGSTASRKIGPRGDSEKGRASRLGPLPSIQNKPFSPIILPRKLRWQACFQALGNAMLRGRVSGSCSDPTADHSWAGPPRRCLPPPSSSTGKGPPGHAAQGSTALRSPPSPARAGRTGHGKAIGAHPTVALQSPAKLHIGVSSSHLTR